jgi:hypothetical protein
VVLERKLNLMHKFVERQLDDQSMSKFSIQNFCSLRGSGRVMLKHVTICVVLSFTSLGINRVAFTHILHLQYINTVYMDQIYLDLSHLKYSLN